MEIRQAVIDDLDIVTKLTLMLYDDNTYEDLLEENRKLLSSKSQVLFLAFDGFNPIGFAHCSLRYDYVEGTDGGNIGYLEGIYVCSEFRKMKVAKTFVDYCEKWAMENGCKEFASDCELDNIDSYNFHLAIGFEEVNRLICFTKKLN